MKFIKKYAFRIGKSYMLKQLDSKVFKEHIISTVNRNIDIPKLNEHQEAELFKAIYKALVIYLKSK